MMWFLIGSKELETMWSFKEIGCLCDNIRLKMVVDTLYVNNLLCANVKSFINSEI